MFRLNGGFIPKAVLAIIAIMAVAAPAQAAKRTIPITTLEAYVSQAVGVPDISISCDPDATFPVGDDGFVQPNMDGSLPRVIHARASACAWAVAVNRKQDRHPSSYITANGQRADIDSGGALEAILHEALHIALQSHDEGIVECTAWRNRWQFVRLFHLPAWVSRMELAGMTWSHDQMPANYRQSC